MSRQGIRSVVYTALRYRRPTHRRPSYQDVCLAHSQRDSGRPTCKKVTILYETYTCTVEPLLRGHLEKRPTPLERPLDNINLNMNVLISTSDKRPPLLKGHISGTKEVASHGGGVHSICNLLKNSTILILI